MPTTPPPSGVSLHQPHSTPNPPVAKRPRIMSNAETSTLAPAVAPISTSPPLLVKKISPSARTPTRGSAFAAGYDIYASEAVTIPARGRKLVGTGLQMAVMEGCCEFLSHLLEVLSGSAGFRKPTGWVEGGGRGKLGLLMRGDEQMGE